MKISRCCFTNGVVFSICITEKQAIVVQPHIEMAVKKMELFDCHGHEHLRVLKQFSMNPDGSGAPGPNYEKIRQHAHIDLKILGST
jgi:hypothetical protein